MVDLITNGAFYQRDPGAEGVLRLLIQGISGAAKNYSACEGNIAAMFNKMSDPSGSSGSTTDAPWGWSMSDPSKTLPNYHTTAINESTA
ncbi:hypothetical protein [Streptomyces sp. NPDC052036]|uniref:hypothetical protein n=1 Tax=Streptomyces sp. NPDC052036 TaxID=3155171 RepID=UPI0034219189